MTKTLTSAVQTLEHSLAVLKGQFVDAVAADSHHILTLRLTLLLIILHGATSPIASVTTRTLGLLMLVLPALASQAKMWWWMIGIILIATNADQWELIDNHQYLITYWTLACCLAIGSPTVLRTSGRLLVAVAFTFAVLWKIVAGEYLDGSFFYLAFITDGRLQLVASTIADGGVPFVRGAGRSISDAMSSGALTSVVPLRHDPSLGAAAIALSWTGLAIEGAVAALHALPHERWYWPRHLSLMAFVAFTYLLLPVVGFGFALAVMGFAQIREDDQRLKRLYLGLLCFLQLSLVPWRNLLAP